MTEVHTDMCTWRFFCFVFYYIALSYSLVSNMCTNQQMWLTTSWKPDYSGIKIMVCVQPWNSPVQLEKADSNQKSDSYTLKMYA